jgi:hypothetical protein
MDDDMQAVDVRDREIERRLESYARARLTPDPRAVARARARVMREARLQFEASRIAAHMAPVVPLATRRSTARRLMMPFLAASLWLGIAVGSISAAQPGGPLYTTRIWIENAALPSGGVARASVELTRLDARLSDALAGAARGDVNAVQAALDAYRQIADQTIAEAAGDPALEALVSAALDQHLAVLAAVASSLEAKGNDIAAAAVEASIQRTIEHNEAVVTRIGTSGAGSGANGGSPAAPGTGGSGNGAGSGAAGNGSTGDGAGGTGGTGGGTDAGDPDKPDKTPKPTPANPEHSPPAHAPNSQDK